MSLKPKIPRAAAIEVARELCLGLDDVTERLVVAGSLRRRRQEVGDIEILYIPHRKVVRADLFGTAEVNLVDERLWLWLNEGRLTKRLNVNGSGSWGKANKYAVHAASGIAVDFFAATPGNWWNYLVCRTGSAESNARVCRAAIAKGWKWNPTGLGFTDEEGNMVEVQSENDVFRLVGLPYLEPWER